MLTGVGREHHGEILRHATRLVEGERVVPRIDPRSFNLHSVDDAYQAIRNRTAEGKLVVDIDTTAADEKQRLGRR